MEVMCCSLMVNGKAQAMKGCVIHKDERLQARLNEVMHSLVCKEWKQWGGFCHGWTGQERLVS